MGWTGLPLIENGMAAYTAVAV